MDGEEKAIWVSSLWAWSLGATVWLVGSIFTGWQHGVVDSVAILFPIMFMATFIAWLFRVTYVSGRNS